MITDRVADTLIRIKNANQARHSVVPILATKMTARIIKVLSEEGYVGAYRIGRIPKDKRLHFLVSLKYSKNSVNNIPNPKIKQIVRVSKPGLRKYVGKNSTPPKIKSLGIVVLSTSQGVMTDSQANNLGIGGEVLFYIW